MASSGGQSVKLWLKCDNFEKKNTTIESNMEKQGMHRYRYQNWVSIEYVLIPQHQHQLDTYSMSVYDRLIKCVFNQLTKFVLEKHAEECCSNSRAVEMQVFL